MGVYNIYVNKTGETARGQKASLPYYLLRLLVIFFLRPHISNSNT